MSKRRQHLWDAEAAYQFNKQAKMHMEPVEHEESEDMMDMEDLETEVAYIEDAHEALSKLFNKSNKRGNQLRGVRRKDAWH